MKPDNSKMAPRRSLSLSGASLFKGYQSPVFHPVAGQTVTERHWELSKVYEGSEGYELGTLPPLETSLEEHLAKNKD